MGGEREGAKKGTGSGEKAETSASNKKLTKKCGGAMRKKIIWGRL